MKKLFKIVVLLFIPLSAFLTVHQVFKSQQLRSEISDLAEEQQRLFERNKRMLTNIAILRSPERIDKLAEEELHLEQINDDKIIHIDIKPSSGEGN